jgi:hypothetical protein
MIKMGSLSKIDNLRNYKLFSIADNERHVIFYRFKANTEPNHHGKHERECVL